MIAAIEQILQTDQSAWETVTAARTKAEHIRSQAERTAEKTVLAGTLELNDAIQTEKACVLADARSQAARIAAEADRYIADLQQKTRAIQSDLIESLLNKVVGP
jgi:hypothetical protein